jgi:DnaJ-class molecular chaperone
MQCPDCEGKGSKVEMKPARVGQPIPSPICQRCDGTGIAPDPKPVRVWHRRKSMRRVT